MNEDDDLTLEGDLDLGVPPTLPPDPPTGLAEPPVLDIEPPSLSGFGDWLL
jgi:hypothetical protein